MKTGVYGGTFNPVHYGHLRAAEEVADCLDLDRIIFVPAGNTPFYKPDLEDGDHRFNMVSRAIEDNPRFTISDIEIKTSGKSFTVDTIGKLKSRYKKSELYFILGIDAFRDLPLWKNPDRLISLSHIVVISRPGYTFAGLADSPYLNGVPKKALRDLDKGSINHLNYDISRKRSGHLLRVTALNISASEIRDFVTAGRNVRYLLPDSVKSYIISNNLYRHK